MLRHDFELQQLREADQHVFLLLVFAHILPDILFGVLLRHLAELLLFAALRHRHAHPIARQLPQVVAQERELALRQLHVQEDLARDVFPL